MPLAEVIPVGRRDHPARDRVRREKTFEGLESCELTGESSAAVQPSCFT